MRINLMLFASARDLMGQEVVQLELFDNATLSDLKAALIRDYPEAAEIVQRSAFSIDHQYAVDDFPLDDSQEIALIPPVSGG